MNYFFHRDSYPCCRSRLKSPRRTYLLRNRAAPSAETRSRTSQSARSAKARTARRTPESSSSVPSRHPWRLKLPAEPRRLPWRIRPRRLGGCCRRFSTAWGIGSTQAATTSSATSPWGPPPSIGIDFGLNILFGLRAAMVDGGGVFFIFGHGPCDMIGGSRDGGVLKGSD